MSRWHVGPNDWSEGGPSFGAHMDRGHPHACECASKPKPKVPMVTVWTGLWGTYRVPEHLKSAADLAARGFTIKRFDEWLAKQESRAKADTMRTKSGHDADAMQTRIGCPECAWGKVLGCWRCGGGW